MSHLGRPMVAQAIIQNNIDAWIIKNIFYNSTIMMFKRKNLKYMYEGCPTKS